MTFEIRQGDAVELMRDMPDASVDAIVTDPPYGLGFMGKAWDVGRAGVAFDPATWREALRVLRPGGHLLAFGGSRTYHRLACAVEDAGFEIRDCLQWLYGSGFPKSLDVSKAIDKAKDDVERHATVARYVVAAMARIGLDRGAINRHFGFSTAGSGACQQWTTTRTDRAIRPRVPAWDQWMRLKAFLSLGDDCDEEVLALNGQKAEPGSVWKAAAVLGEHEGVPGGFGDHRFTVRDTKIREASAAASAWGGWGTALKPAHEPIVLARKPLVGTVAANVLEHGTGALNIDGCRIAAEGGSPAEARRASARRSGNVPVSERSAAEAKADGRIENRAAPDVYMAARAGEAVGRWPANVLLDEDAARILDEQSGTREGRESGPRPFRKASSGATAAGNVGAAFGAESRSVGAICGIDRGDGGGASRFFYTAKAGSDERHWAGKNTHPTVKPVDLMRWLCRLITPKRGLVLDPFMGSGSTGVAALAEGFRFIGIERDPEYVEIARRRIAGPLFVDVDQADAAPPS